MLRMAAVGLLMAGACGSTRVSLPSDPVVYGSGGSRGIGGRPGGGAGGGPGLGGRDGGAPGDALHDDFNPSDPPFFDARPDRRD